MNARTALLTAAALTLVAATSRAADFSGIWVLASPKVALKTDTGAAPPLTPKAQADYAEYRASIAGGNVSADPANHCKPLGLPRALMQMDWPWQWAQSAGRVDQLFQWNRLDRTILVSDHFVTSANDVQDSGGPYELGDSIGQWDGDTFVVQLAQEDSATALDPTGLPHSDAMTLTERYTLIDHGRKLQDKIHIVDPATYTAPWDTTLIFRRAPAGTDIKEDVCIERLKLNSFATIDNSLRK